MALRLRAAGLPVRRRAVAVPALTALLAALLLPASGPARAAAPTCAGQVAGNRGSGQDVNGDGFADLAIGAPGAVVNGSPGAGLVQVRYGIDSVNGDGQGLGATQMLRQGLPGVVETPEPGDGFGAVVRLGLVDNDTCADLVIGVPGEDLIGAPDAGVVHVIFGAPGGLGSGRVSLVLRAGVRGLGGVPTAGDRFGAAVAVTDFFGFSPAATVPNSLAIGIPGRDVGAVADAGAVDVLSFAAATGAPFDPRLVTQDSPGVGGAVEPGAGFGTAVAFGYAGGSQRWLLDLLAGAPGSHAGGGAVVVVSDRGAAQPYAGAEWTQDTPGVADTEEAAAPAR